MESLITAGIFQSLADRVDLDLGSAGAEVEAMPTDERVKRLSSGQSDPGLIAEYFQYGRYLLISCSRPGGMPANLQGLWSAEMKAAWNKRLPHRHQHPDELLARRGGQSRGVPRAALRLDGHAGRSRKPDGEDRVRGPRPTGRPSSDRSLWLHLAGRRPVQGESLADGGCVARAALHGKHYAFSGDKEFLAKRAYPAMKGAARFIIDFLVPSPRGFPPWRANS